MKRTTIMLPIKLKAQAQQQARRNGESLGEFIRASVQEKLGQHGNKPRRRLFSDAIAIADDGPADVAGNAGRYLDELRRKDYERVQAYARKSKGRQGRSAS